MKSWLFAALILALPAWADPYATALLPSDPQITACDYEDTTTGETARLPVVIDSQRGEAPDFRVCRFDVAHWIPGSVHAARARSVNAAGATSSWINATLDRPSGQLVASLVAGAPDPIGDSVPITYSVVTNDTGTFRQYSPLSGGSLTVATDDIVVHCVVFADPNSAGTLTVTKASGSATIGSVSLVDDIGDSGVVRLAVYWFKVTAGGSLVMQTAWDSGSAFEVEHFHLIHTGANTTTPVPAGNVYKGTGATSKSQSITPTASGSALWMLAGDTADATTYAAGASNTLVNVVNDPDDHSTTLVRPTTQPRTDASAFTLAETHTGSGGSWIAFEVVAAGGGGGGFQPAWARPRSGVIGAGMR